MTMLMMLPVGVSLAQKAKVGITAEEYSLVGKRVSAMEARIADLEREIEEIKARHRTQGISWRGRGAARAHPGRAVP